MMQFDTIQKFGRDGVEAAFRSFGAIATGTQAAATEIADYAKRSFEQGSQVAERLAGVRTVDAALQLQSEYLRASYEGVVAQVTKMGELATNTGKEAFAPVEGLMSKRA